MPKRDYYARLTVESGYKKSIVALSAIEIFLSLSSIGLAIPAIVFARQNYIDCYYSGVAACPLYGRLNLYTLTAQGIWGGVMVIISAAIAIDFTKVSTWKTWSYMNGFSQIANMLTGGMIALEALAVSEYIAGGYQPQGASDYVLWCLHNTLLAIACALWLITSIKHGVICKVRKCGRVDAANSDAAEQTPPPAIYVVGTR